MKYKIIGAIDCLVGVLVFLQSASFLFFVLPKMNTLYREADIVRNQPLSSYILSIVMLLLGAAGIFLGYTQFTSNKQKYIKWALVIPVILILGLIFYISQIITSVINPIYNLTNSIK